MTPREPRGHPLDLTNIIHAKIPRPRVKIAPTMGSGYLNPFPIFENLRGVSPSPVSTLLTKGRKRVEIWGISSKHKGRDIL